MKGSRQVLEKVGRGGTETLWQADLSHGLATNPAWEGLVHRLGGSSDCLGWRVRGLCRGDGDEYILGEV